MRTLLLLSIALLSVTSVQAEEYWLKRGYVWDGVNVGGEPIHGRDKICRDKRCIPIGPLTHRPINALMRENNIRDYSFEELKKAALDNIDDKRLKLPNELGKSIYHRAWVERSRGNDGRPSGNWITF